MLNLSTRLLLLLENMSTVLLVILIYVLCVVLAAIIGGVHGTVLLVKLSTVNIVVIGHFLKFWYSLGLEKVFGSVDGLSVSLFDLDTLFNNICYFLLLSFLCLFNSFDKRFISTKIKLVRLFRNNFLLL